MQALELHQHPQLGAPESIPAFIQYQIIIEIKTVYLRSEQNTLLFNETSTIYVLNVT